MYTRRGIHQKYMVPDKSKMDGDEEDPSGIICDSMDILYVLEMNLAFYTWYISVGSIANLDNSYQDLLLLFVTLANTSTEYTR